MSKFHFGVVRYCFVVLGLVAFFPVHAEDSEAGFTISPMIGMYHTGTNRGLDDSEFLSLGVGYEFNSKWAVELSYVGAEFDVESSSTEVDLEMLRLDGLYYFLEDQFRPYVVAGFSDGEFDTSGYSEDDTFGNFGIGFKYLISRNVAFRTDFRLQHGFDSGANDYLLGVGLLFKFGDGNASRAKPRKETPVAQNTGPKDSDNDGVADQYDACPKSKAGADVDANGCVDGDNDGVADKDDLCLETSAGAKVDASGCYLTLNEDVSVSLQVNFETNSDRVVNGSEDDIQKVAEFLRAYPQTKVVIEGHTDSLGAAEYNRTLSQRRAEAVANILVNDFNVDRSRVSAKGYGEEQPLVDNSTAANRAKNRRVQAVVSATVEKTIQ